MAQKEPDLNTPGGKIWFLRRSKGWTQVTLASKVKCTQASISQWEHNVILPNREYQRVLADVLDVTRTFLFGEDVGRAA